VSGAAPRVDLDRGLVRVCGPDRRRELPADHVIVALGSTVERQQLSRVPPITPSCLPIPLARALVELFF